MSSLFPVTAYTGGTRVPLEQASALRARGHGVQLFGGYLGGGGGLGLKRTIIDEFPATLVNVRGRLANGDPGFRGHAGADRAFAQVLKSGFDVVHFHSVQGLGSEMLTLARSAGAATVLQMHDFYWVCDRQFLVTRDGLPCSRQGDPGCVCSSPSAAGSANARDLGDLTLVPTLEMATWLANMGEASHFHVGGQPGATLPRAAASDMDWDLGTPYLVYLGGPSAEKGWMVLLEAAWASAPGALRVLCPGIPKRAVPQELSDKLVGGPRADRARVATLLGSARAAVVPSVAAETYSYVAREALGLGTHVIITDGPGGVDVASKHSSLVDLVPRGSPDHLRTAMELALSRPQERSAPQQLPPQDLGAELEALYLRLLKQGSTGP